VQSQDHPELAFVQAKGYTPGRPDGPPIWVVIHDMEASETPTRAESTAVYFSNPPDGRNVSSHYCWDSDSGVQCVRLRDSAWTVGNRPGNNRGINHELAGFANQTREQWLDPYGRAMLARIAPIVQADAAKYGIPLERRTVAELQAWQPGITSHNDLRLAFGGTTHTDPGGQFPWDYFIDLLNGGDMTIYGMLCQQGDTGPVVGALQRMLNQVEPAGQIAEDNNYGPATVAKLARVLATVGWAVDGKNFLRGEYERLHAAHILAVARAGGIVGPPGPAGPPGPQGEPGPATLVPHSHDEGQTGPAEPQ